MSNLTLNSNLALSLAQSEEQFPIDLDDAWRWLGWTTKQQSKLMLLNNAIEEVDFLREHLKKPGRGRSSEKFYLTLDCFKALAMMAGTAKGKEVRRYFIEAEKTLKIVQRLDPELVLKAEMIKDEARCLELRQDVVKAEQYLLDKRDWIVRTLPEVQQQRILGYTEVKTVEYRDRVIRDEEIVNDGSTLNKTALCRRYGFLRKGKPDYKLLNQYLEDLGPECFEQSVRFVENLEVRREALRELDSIVQSGERQQWLGE